MADTALRAAERAYTTDPTPETGDRLHAERTRAGLMCDVEHCPRCERRGAPHARCWSRGCARCAHGD